MSQAWMGRADEIFTELKPNKIKSNAHSYNLYYNDFARNLLTPSNQKKCSKHSLPKFVSLCT